MERQKDRVESTQSDLQTHLCYFGHDVSLVCEEEFNCQISSEDAYFQIKSLWLELKNSQPEIAIYLENTNCN